MTISMSPTKKKTALATRSVDSFLLFKEKEFVSGLQPFVTIQPLNKSKVRGWFVRKSDLDTCGWNATAADFNKGSVHWDYKQTFGMPPNTTVEEGLNFVSPRIQILMRSPLMVEESTGMRQTIGTLDDPNVKDIFDADKTAAELAQSKGEMYKRRYAVRTKYLIYVLKSDNTPAHKIPMVLTIKGLNGTDISEKVKLFEKEMSKCLSKALGTEVPLQFNEKFHSTTVFIPTLVSDMRGKNTVEICAIEGFDIPDYSTTEAAIESLHRLTIPDEDRDAAWKKQNDPWYQDYINQHSLQDAKKLGGAYGIKDGVKILPQGSVEVAATAVNADTGEDSTL
tara:strand:- start:803 stop:1813 length:1011 start_codon:yes stop_codon:yes gene_type:complete